jgi:hypothetical protein
MYLEHPNEKKTHTLTHPKTHAHTRGFFFFFWVFCEIVDWWSSTWGNFLQYVKQESFWNFRILHCLGDLHENILQPSKSGQALMGFITLYNSYELRCLFLEQLWRWGFVVIRSNKSWFICMGKHKCVCRMLKIHDSKKEVRL